MTLQQITSALTKKGFMVSPTKWYVYWVKMERYTYIAHIGGPNMEELGLLISICHNKTGKPGRWLRKQASTVIRDTEKLDEFLALVR